MCGAGHAVQADEDGALALGVMDDGGRIVLGPAARELRRALRPIEWVVLEDVALDARRDDAGALVAPTSARRVAEHLGLTPGAVARALARLRSKGLVTHARQAGPAGRFGLSAYVLGAVPGLDVVLRHRRAIGHTRHNHARHRHTSIAHVRSMHTWWKRRRRAAKPRALPDRHGDRCTTTSLERWRRPSTTSRPRNVLARPAGGHRRGPHGGRPPESATTQLSILDATVDSERDRNPDRQP